MDETGWAERTTRQEHCDACRHGWTRSDRNAERTCESRDAAEDMPSPAKFHCVQGVKVTVGVTSQPSRSTNAFCFLYSGKEDECTRLHIIYISIKSSSSIVASNQGTPSLPEPFPLLHDPSCCLESGLDWIGVYSSFEMHQRKTRHLKSIAYVERSVTKKKLTESAAD